jgi:cyclopropane-fatty-acyl-phospholipid synthase
VNAADKVAPLLSKMLGPRAPMRIDFWDGSSFGPAEAAARVEYFTHLQSLLRQQGRLLNHGISRPPGGRKSRFARKSFIDSFVFPDGELHEVGRVTSCMQESGFEVRDLENLQILGVRSGGGGSGVPLRRGDTIL